MLTPVETAAIVRGYVSNLERRSADFRMLYALKYNSMVKAHDSRTPQQLWPLMIDNVKREPEMSIEDIKARNKRIIEQFQKN